MWNKPNQENTHIIQNSHLIQQVINRFQQDDYQLQSQYIDCITTIHIMDPGNLEKTSYRANPYFFKRPWHDWCSTSWDIDDTNIHQFPSRLLFIIDTINMDFDADVKMLGRYWAIVRATELDSRTTSQRQNQDCLLINTYDTDKFIRIISCNSIRKPVFMIPDVTSVSSDVYKTQYHSNQVIHIKQITDWPKIFMESKWL